VARIQAKNTLSSLRIFNVFKATKIDFFLSCSMLLLGASFHLIWIFGGYGGIPFTQYLSFLVNDGWCEVPAQSLFTHCFGDYAIFSTIFNGDAPIWTTGDAFSSPYPASSLLPIKLFHEFGLYFGYSIGRNIYLLAMLLSLLTPAFIACRGKAMVIKVATVTLLGLTSLPLLITLDRGNSIGFVIGPLSLAVLALTKGQHVKFSFFVIVSALIKPQMVLFFLLLLAVRKYKLFIKTSSIFISIFILSFGLFPGQLLSNLKSWFSTVFNYLAYADLTQFIPLNLSVDRSLLTIFEMTNSNLSMNTNQQVETIGRICSLLMLFVVLFLVYRISAFEGIPGLVMLISILVITFTGTSFSYYSSLLLIPISLMLAEPETESIIQDKDASIISEVPHVTVILDRIVILFATIVFAPIYLPIQFFPRLEKVLGITDSNLNSIQIFWGLILLSIFFLTVFRLSIGNNKATSPKAENRV
jgi:hypothetical protein